MNKKLTLAAVAAFAVMASAQATTFHWDGSDTEGRVDTGSEAETAGYWYTYTDNDAPNNGDSKITFPADVEENAYGNFFGPLCEAYGGIKGTATLGTAYEYPFVGLGFNVMSEDQEGGNIAPWTGICLTYSSTAAFAIELGVEGEATVTEYNNYKAAVAKSASVTSVDYPWAKFKQESGWGKTVAQAEVLAATSAIKLKFASASGDFFIQEIGSVGQCGTTPLPTPAISKTQAAASFKAQLSGRTLSFGKSVAKAEIINLQGQVVMAASSVKSMDLSKVQAGVYMVRAEGMSQQIMVK